MFPFLHLLPAKLIRRAFLRPYRAIGGFLTEGEAVALFRIANRLPSKACAIEIGSWKGKSTFCIGKGLRGSARLYAIDPFDAFGEPGSASVYERERSDTPLRTQFDNNTRPVSDRIEVLQGYSRSFIDRFNEIDFLLIDGDHSIAGARFDFEHYASKLKPGGYLLFHDYYPDRDELGPTWVISNLVVPSNKFRQVACADSLWIGQRV